jgi:beta-fructofuranosidase
MNDPNGLIQWQGRYHLFYQHNPNAAVWGDIHWGHAMSEDLVHWQDLPIALAPTPGGVDADGVFSGCAVDDHGVATLLYTGIRYAPDGTRVERPCLATSPDDDLRTWRKYSGNPVIATPPEGLGVLGFRDHCVWREPDGTWRQLIGSGIRNVGGTALLYASPDLRHWEYLHPLLIGDGSETGTMWECPDLFPLGDEHVLVVSPVPLQRSLYAIGPLRQQRFSPRRWAPLDAGGYLYAPQSFADANGRRIMFGWLWEGRDEAAQRAAGWAGVMSLPRVLTLVEGELTFEPAAELRALRSERWSTRDVSLGPRFRAGLSGVGLEIEATIEPRSASQVGLAVRCAPDASEQTVIVYDTVSERLSIDRSKASLDPTTKRDERAASLPLRSSEPLRLHVFVDRSVVEVFANGRICLTTRVYPSRTDSTGVELLASGGGAHVSALDVWQLRSSLQLSRGT